MFDTTKPDGTPRKLLDVSRLHALGWRHRIDLREGIASTYEWFTEHERSGTDSDVAQQHGDDNRELNPSTAS